MAGPTQSFAQYRGVFWILGAATSYATVAIFGKWIFALHIPMWTALSWRFGISALILWTWNQSRNIEPISVQNRNKCFLIGLLGDTCRTTLFFLTIGRLGASLASLLLYTFPFFVFLLQRLLFKRSATKLQWIALTLSSLGCFFAIAPFGKDATRIDDWLGILFGLGAGLAEAGYITFSHHVTKGIPAAAVVSYLSRGALLSFGTIAFFMGQLVLPNTPIEWTVALSIGIFATVIPAFCLMRGLQMTGASQAALLFTIEPVITIFLAMALFEESLTMTKMLGALFILGSAALIQKQEEKIPLKNQKIVNSGDRL